MVLSNREKQQRWRERHIKRRRTVQRIASLLLRRTWNDEHFTTLGGLLQSIMNTRTIVALRRALKPRTDAGMAAIHDDWEIRWQELWLHAHPGRTRAEYKRLLRDEASEVWEWRKAKGKAAVMAEKRAWQTDHPGEKFPEHECGLTDREYTDLERWRRRRAARGRKVKARQ